MNEIQAVLFDLGNTLATSASLAASLANLDHSRVINELRLNSQQLKALGEEIERQIARLDQDSRSYQPHWLDVWQSAITLCNLNLNSNQSERLCRAHLQQFVSECKVEPYSIPLLAALQKSKIPLGLVSNVTGPVELFDLDLHEKGLASFFQVVVWSSSAGYRKPDARIFQHALNRLGQSPGKTIFMVGDHEHADISGGKNMGFTTVKVVKGEKETESDADYVVPGPSLLEFFQLKLKQREPNYH
jgi:putative hydrolase of the HAD superfamily